MPPTGPTGPRCRNTVTLRAALTGRVTSPGIFEVLAVLGKDESLGRIADQGGAAAARAQAG